MRRTFTWRIGPLIVNGGRFLRVYRVDLGLGPISAHLIWWRRGKRPN